jgi:hypothetical protein
MDRLNTATHSEAAASTACGAALIIHVWRPTDTPPQDRPQTISRMTPPAAVWPISRKNGIATARATEMTSTLRCTRGESAEPATKLPIMPATPNPNSSGPT